MNLYVKHYDCCLVFVVIPLGKQFYTILNF
jgi:hypothetical protein